MRGLFSGFYRPTEDEFTQLWKNCIFVFDANVLLNLYRYPTPARDDLLKILESIPNRIWIPYQAALEYQRNRPNVIADQLRRFDDVRRVLNDTENSLSNGLEKLQLEKRHSSIRTNEFIEGIKGQYKLFKEQLYNLEQQQSDVSGHDSLRETIDSLFKNCIGQPLESQKDLDALYQIAALRYERMQPPGYVDAHKEDDCYFYNELCYKNKFGDFVLWSEIIEHANVNSIKKIVFVTDDKKEDWWWIVNSRGEKNLGPRPELTQEIKSRAGVDSFYMYNSERFMGYAQKYLGIEIPEESIKQVRDFSSLALSTPLPPNTTEDIVRDYWMSKDGYITYVLTVEDTVALLWKRSGDSWENIWFGAGIGLNNLVLRICPTDPNVVYLPEIGSTKILFTPNGGERWVMRASRYPIEDLMVESRDVAYVKIAGTNLTSKSTNSGFTWLSPE